MTSQHRRLVATALRTLGLPAIADELDRIDALEALVERWKSRALAAEREVERRSELVGGVIPPSAALRVGGNCPVQGEGWIRRADRPDAYVYFRARGSEWSVDVYEDPKWNGENSEVSGYLPDSTPTWSVWAPWGVWPDAGWMSDDTALDLCERMVDAYLAGWPGEPQVPR